MLIPQFNHFTVCKRMCQPFPLCTLNFSYLQQVSLKTMSSFILQENFTPNFRSVKEECMRLVHPGSRICNRERGWKNFSGEVGQHNNDRV